MKKSMWRGILLTLAVSGCSFGSEPESWPQWRGPKRDGISASKGLLKEWPEAGPKLAWITEGVGGGYASVSIADGKIFTTGNLENGQAIIALDQKTGEVVWTQAITDKKPEHSYDGSRSTPTYDNGKLYAVASSGNISCVDAKTGKLLWQREFGDWKGQMMSGWGFSESPLIDGDWVLCTPGSSEAGIVALDKNTGKEVWKAAIPSFGDGKNAEGKDLRPGAGYASIIVSEAAGVRQYVQLLGNGVVSVRASDGKFLWGYDEVVNNVANIPTPIPIDDYIFVSTGYGTGSALLKLEKDGDGVVAKEEYFLKAKDLQNHHGGLIRLGDYIYCGHKHNEGFPICIEWKTGKTVWGGNERGPGKGSAAVTYADGNLIFRYQDGTVALIEASTSELKVKGEFMPEYQERESWSHPVVVDGMLYLREQNKVMCYDLRAK